jgi:hypothetical protein
MKKITLLIIVIAGAVFYFKNTAHIEEESNTSLTTKEIKKSSKKESSHDHNHAHISPTKDSKNKEKVVIKEVPIPTDKHGKSLEQFNEILFSLAKSTVDVEELKDSLIDKGLKLTIANDSNEHTGSMSIIRTKNTLPGTRYFHAQIFKDENGDSFVQHMSFEYRPGKYAFEQAVASTKVQFKLNRNPDVSTKDFASWSLDSGHTVWIKKMGLEDLKNDPFNAYTDADVGTIKVAKELEIH